MLNYFLDSIQILLSVLTILEKNNVYESNAFNHTTYTNMLYNVVRIIGVREKLTTENQKAHQN